MAPVGYKLTVHNQLLVFCLMGSPPHSLGHVGKTAILTMRARPFAAINFDFAGVADYAGVGRVEIVTFTCPQWGIGVGTIYGTNILLFAWGRL